MPATISINELSRYFANLLAYEYRNSPRAYAQMNLWAKQAVFDAFPLQVQDAFNVDTAIGAQLDIIGKYVGVPRNIGLPVARPYFGFYDIGASDQNPNGFADSTAPAVNAQAIFFQAYFQGAEDTALSDEAYRLIIKLKIILNQNDGTLSSIQTFLNDFLPGLFLLTDNADMTLTYNLLSPPPVAEPVLERYLPKPAGVAVNFVYPTSSASPDTLTTSTPTIFPPVNFVVTSAASTATPDPAGSALYFWEYVSGDPITITSPYTPASTFSYSFNTWTTVVGVFRCRVTTIPGAFVSYTNPVTVTLTATP